MRKVSLPRDQHQKVIQVMGLADAGAHVLTSAAGEVQKNATAFDATTNVITVYFTAAVYIKFGFDNTVVAAATDHYIPAGLRVPIALGTGDQNDTNYSYMSMLPVVVAATKGYVSENQ